MTKNPWNPCCPAYMYALHSGESGSLSLNRIMLMKVMRMEGAHLSVVLMSPSNPPATNAVHLWNIKRDMWPNKQLRKMIWGTNSQKMLTDFPKYLLFHSERMTPNIMWMTPMIMESFILKEFKKLILLTEICHTGSTPKG